MRYTEEELKLIEIQNRNRVLAAQPANKLDIEILSNKLDRLVTKMQLLQQNLTEQKSKGK